MPVGTIIGSIISGNAAKKAAKEQTKAADKATDIQLQAQREAIAALQEMYDTSRADLAPYREAGSEALNTLTAETKPGGDFSKDFTAADFETDPGYQFRLSEGMKALERSASARGGVLSGRTLKDINRFGQEYASDEYNKAYTRFNLDRERRFNRLASLAGLGQTATTSTTQLSSQTGQNLASTYLGTGSTVSDIALQRGNAKASGIVGQSSAYAQGLRAIDEYNIQLLNAAGGVAGALA